MNANGHSAPDEMFDLALQDILNGVPVQEVIGRYPEAGALEFEPLLQAARTINRARHPELPASSISALVARAQAQARNSADKTQAVLSLPPAPTSEIASPPRARNVGLSSRRGIGSETTGVRPEARERWPGRFLAWLNVGASPVRAAMALVVVLVTLAGLGVLARITQPTVIPVPPEVSVPFSFDGPIQGMASDRWIVEGITVQVSSDTEIIGLPSVGALARVEGDLQPGDRRLATRITILSSNSTPESSPTAAVAITTTPGNVVRSPGDSSSTPRAVGQLPGSPTETRTPVVDRTPTTAGRTRPPSTVSRTVTPRPTTPSASTPTHAPSATRAPTTEPTPGPEETPLPGSTLEPEDTPTPANSSTALPATTTTPTSIPTAARTHTPAPSPTRAATSTEEPTEEPTDEPSETAVGAPPTGTPQGTWTPAPIATSTGEAEETQSPEPTQEPDKTHGLEPSPTR